MTTITLNKGGKGETQVEIESLQIPDLWHIANWIEGEAIKRRNAGESDLGLDLHAKAILDTWHLAHDLKTHILESKP